MIYFLFCRRFVFLICLTGFSFWVRADAFDSRDTAAPGKKLLQYIDPTIGNVAQLLEPTRPTAYLPNQLIRVHPIRKDYLDDQIAGFPLTVVSHRLGTAFCIRPAISTVSAESWDEKMPYDQDLEINRPWYYSTYLLNDGITVEFSPSKKTGIYRFSFPPGKRKSILINTCNEGDGTLQMNSGNEISGMETWHGDVHVFMYGVFNISGRGAKTADKHFESGIQRTGKTVKININFSPESDTVEFRYAISFVSEKQAETNYKNEISGHSFSAVEYHAEKIWSDLLSQIQVEGGTPAQRRSFYTALYRCHERMVDISEDSLYYSGYNHKINQDKRPFYVDDWSWDTYLALHPLRMILHPAQEEDMLQSY
ncbi:MAG TPA: glycoside hydrolase domain-containing protein, partial [Puia sp.]|nr:glycoside hydrolase domain-containing protein [Puia sp.]